MTEVKDLNCDPITRNAVIRKLASDAEELGRFCVCDVHDIKNIGLRRIYKLQMALEEVGLTLRPCRFVAEPILPWRKTPNWDHQQMIQGVWCTRDSSSFPSVWIPDEQEHETVNETLPDLKEMFG